MAAYDPRGNAKDAIAVLHHFGWNACSSALCHGGHAGMLERRYLVMPGLRSSRTYILDTKPDPRAPAVTREIGADEPAEPVLVAAAGGVLAQAAFVSLRASFRGQRPRDMLLSRPAAATTMAAIVTALAVVEIG